MNWKQLIELIDPNREPSLSYTAPAYEADLSDFCELFDLPPNYSEEFGKRVKKHWLVSWICTTTRVGLAAYFMDGKPVAVSMQKARKSDETIMFIERESMLELREFVISLLPKPDEAEVLFVDLECEVNPNWWEIGIGRDQWRYDILKEKKSEDR